MRSAITNCTTTRETCRGRQNWPFRRAVALLALPLLLALSERRSSADEVTKWNMIAGQASLASGMSETPPVDSRLNAMTFVAVHDALNAIQRRYDAYQLHISAAPTASAPAAAATAAHDVLVNQYRLLAALGYISQQTMLSRADHV